MKNWLTNLWNGVLQNLLANILLIIAIPLIGGIYAFYTTNPQTALIVVLILLTTINTIMSLALLRHQRSADKSLRELSHLKQMSPLPAQDRDPLSSQANDSLRLIFFSSDNQTTELRGTKDGLEVYLSDLRPGKNNGIQGDVISVDRLRKILQEGDVKVYTDDGTPMLDIGPKKYWFYSKTLFGDPKRLQREIYALIERTIKFASQV